MQRGGGDEREGTKRKSTTSTVATRKFDFQIGVARTSGQRGRVRRTGHGGRGVENTRNPGKSRRCVPSWRSCVGGRECALEKGRGEVIQHDRDGSTALGSLELLMRPPSSLSLFPSIPSPPLSPSSSHPSFPFPCPCYPATLPSDLLSPLPFPRVHSSLDQRLRDEHLVPRSFHSHSRIFIPTNSRNAVIAQLRELVSPPRYFFLLATAKRAFTRFPSLN